MKHILALLVFSAIAFSQPQPFAVWFSNPAGQVCNAGQGAMYAGAVTTMYTCQNGVFVQVSGGGGASLAPFTTDGTNVTLPSGTLSVDKTLLTNGEYDNGTCTTAKTISPANGNRQKVMLTTAQTCALTFTQPTSGTVSIQITIIQSSVGPFTGAISGGKWPSGVGPTITQTSAAQDIITCYLNGTDAKCVATQDFR